jgi:hypothetical protein
LALEQIFFGFHGIPFGNFGVLTAIILIVGVGLGTLTIYNMNRGETVLLQTAQVSPQESYLVLSNVLKNNSLLLTSSASQNGLLTEMLAQNNNLPSAIENPQLDTQTAALNTISDRSYNFFHTVYTKEPGPLAISCLGANTASDNVTVETFDYTYNGSNYLKTINTTTDNSSYSMFITDNTGIKEYNSNTTNQEFTKILQTPNAVASPQGQLDLVFGADVSVKKIFREGKLYYQLITMENNQSIAFCTAPNNANEGMTDNTLISTPTGSPTEAVAEQVYIVHTVDPSNDYQIIETNYYLGEISAAKLVFKSSYKSEKANLQPEGVIEKYFSFKNP